MLQAVRPPRAQPPRGQVPFRFCSAAAICCAPRRPGPWGLACVVGCVWLRGAGQPGGWSGPGKAELADPYAKANEAYIEPVEVCLRHVASALLEGTDGDTGAKAAADLRRADPDGNLASCLAYLRDRVGVPRDMGQAAAMQLRAHLNWAISLL